MRRILAWLAVAGMLLPGIAGAPVSAAEPRTTILVLFAPGVGATESAALHELAGGVVTGTIPEIDLQRVIVDPARLSLYRSAPIVRAAEPERVWSLMGEKDPLFKDQWAMKTLDARGVWKIEKGKKNPVSVAVIDTGVDVTHEDLEGRVAEGYDFTELDADVYDDHGHGTHVSGVIAANVSNGKGIAGLSQGATIIPMKACTAADGGCPPFQQYASAIDAVRRGADIINMSLGGAAPCSEIDQTVFDWVHSQGVLTVVSAGNDAQNDNPVITPASCDYTLGVGATDENDRRAAFSSHGFFVDIAAPGVAVWSTLPPLVSIGSTHIGYGAWSGTSMAAPYVAAAAALVKAQHPDWTPDQITEKLLSSARDAGKRGRDRFYGEGILDVKAALR